MPSIINRILTPYKSKLDPDLMKKLENDLHQYFSYQEEYSHFLNATIDSVSKEVEEYKKKILENQQLIIERNKMATIGEVTATLSHEINNQLMILYGNCQIIEMINEEIKNKDIEASVVNCISTLENMSRLIKNIKKFSHHQITSEIDYIIDSPLSLINQTINVCDHFLSKSKVKVIIEENIKDDFQCSLASSEVGQVLLNLIKNAFDHANQQNEDKDKWIKIKSEIINDIIKISISNGGKLLDKSVTENLFHPFFTTKEIGKGTGIGLSLSYKIMDTLKGKIYYDDSDAKINFVLEIPINYERPLSESA